MYLWFCMLYLHSSIPPQWLLAHMKNQRNKGRKDDSPKPGDGFMLCLQIQQIFYWADWVPHRDWNRDNKYRVGEWHFCNVIHSWIFSYNDSGDLQCTVVYIPALCVASTKFCICQVCGASHYFWIFKLYEGRMYRIIISWEVIKS